MLGEHTPLPARLSYLRPHAVTDLVRRGNAKDGGYVLPFAPLAGLDALVSFGLATDWSLEEDLHRANPALKIHVYDHSVGAKSFRRALKNAIVKFASGRISWGELRSRYRTDWGYRRFFVGTRMHFRERVFNRRDNANDATIETVFQRLGEARHVFLKMDIEGAEYRVIPQILAHAERIDLLTIEFHDTDPLRAVFEAQVRAILEHFDIVHLHGNNIAGIAADGLPDCLEITFLSKRFPITGSLRDRLPIEGLDYPNNPHAPDLPLRFS
jgi:Methyltransferase FkbM domain